MMESLIRQFYIFFFIVLFSSWAAAVRFEEPSHEEIKKQNLDRLFGKLCPPFGFGLRYEVSTIQTETTMFGCTYLEHNLTISAAPVFNLWLERPGKTSDHGHCKDTRNMDHFAFECVLKKKPTKKEEISKGWHYVTLLDHSQPSISQDNNDLVFRCAVYEVNDAPAEGVKIIRMAISAPSKEQMHEDLCANLSKTMAKDDLPYTSKGRHQTWPDGAVYLYMLGKISLDGPSGKQEEIVKYSTSLPMKSTTTTQLTTMKSTTTTQLTTMKSTTTTQLTTMELTTTKPIVTTRSNKKLEEFLDSLTTTTRIPNPQNVFDYLYLFVNGQERPR